MDHRQPRRTAEFGGKLHRVHRGSGSDTALWHATFNGTSWSADTRLAAHSSLEGPGLAVLDGKLYLVHRGHGSGDKNLWWSTYKAAPGAPTPCSPATPAAPDPPWQPTGTPTPPTASSWSSTAATARGPPAPTPPRPR
ncbi:hypothetical protein ACFRCI_16430 [Streptomyces sp. NPDC056638]|uniref:hypothetical protein n=1 Tax=Streptomyces sp. NPDC056638 TaxID=3345887 RepID=UPI0036C4604D